MKHDLRILLLEDNPLDAELIEHALRAGGVVFAVRRVEKKADFLREVEKPPPDVILSDYALPSFDGLTALAIAREKCPDVPFIFVTGTMGEEVAIETLKNGATDYILKSRLSRLGPAVRRALREAGERAERKRAEEQLLESHEQLRALSAHLQSVREQERTRIAREVHDELGQALTSLKLALSRLGRQLPRTLKSHAQNVKPLVARIDSTIQTVRRIATELRPGILDDLGLVAAIEWQANDFQEHTGIRCQVSAMVKEPVLNQELTTAFFRIFQETLTNVIRHARATRVEVQLRRENGSLLLEVKDNGLGISEAQISGTQSIGLRGMRERAELLGGQLSIQAHQGQGTAVTVKIPLRQSVNHKGQIMNHRRGSHENPDHRRPRHGAKRLAPRPGG